MLSWSESGVTIVMKDMYQLVVKICCQVGRYVVKLEDMYQLFVKICCQVERYVLIIQSCSLVVLTSIKDGKPGLFIVFFIFLLIFFFFGFGALYCT